MTKTIKQKEQAKEREEKSKLHIGDIVTIAKMFFNHHTISNEVSDKIGFGRLISVHQAEPTDPALYYVVDFPFSPVLAACHILGFLPSHIMVGDDLKTSRIKIHPAYIEKCKEVKHGKKQN